MMSFLLSLTKSPSRLIACLTTATALLLIAMPTPEGIPPNALTGAALCLLAIGLYATAVIPEYLTALVFFTLAMILGTADANVVFSGFHSAAYWLVFGGLIVGVAVQKTGLGLCIATSITSRLAQSYTQTVIGIALVGIALAFVMPSTMGRVVLLVPIVLALCESLGYEKGTPERSGLILAMACGTWMPANSVLPANVPNMVLVGVAENLFGVTFNYGEYLLMHMPVNGILKLVIIISLILVIFRSTGRTQAAPTSEEDVNHLSRDGRRLVIILGITFAFWTTDFIHHISPAWIAMAAAMVCLWPGIGLIDGDDIKARFNFPSTIYVAGILSLGALLVETGAGDIAGKWLLAHITFSKDTPFMSFVSMVGLGTAANIATTAPSVPAVIAPLAADIAASSGLPLKTVLMSQVIAYSTVILPYQVPPLIVAMQLGGIPIKDGAKMTVALAAVSLLILVPLNYLWWSWLGLMQ
jgi:anion transporter